MHLLTELPRKFILKLAILRDTEKSVTIPLVFENGNERENNVGFVNV